MYLPLLSPKLHPKTTTSTAALSFRTNALKLGNQNKESKACLQVKTTTTSLSLVPHLNSVAPKRKYQEEGFLEMELLKKTILKTKEPNQSLIASSTMKLKDQMKRLRSKTLLQPSEIATHSHNRKGNQIKDQEGYFLLMRTKMKTEEPLLLPKTRSQILK